MVSKFYLNKAANNKKKNTEERFRASSERTFS